MAIFARFGDRKRLLSAGTATLSITGLADQRMVLKAETAAPCIHPLRFTSPLNSLPDVYELKISLRRLVQFESYRLIPGLAACLAARDSSTSGIPNQVVTERAVVQKTYHLIDNTQGSAYLRSPSRSRIKHLSVSVLLLQINSEQNFKKSTHEGAS